MADSRRLDVMRKMLGNAIGIEECLLAMGLILLTVGAWPVFERVALMLPGLVLIWLALPSRKTFIERPQPATIRKRTP